MFLFAVSIALQVYFVKSFFCSEITRSHASPKQYQGMNSNSSCPGKIYEQFLLFLQIYPSPALQNFAFIQTIIGSSPGAQGAFKSISIDLFSHHASYFF